LASVIVPPVQNVHEGGLSHIPGDSGSEDGTWSLREKKGFWLREDQDQAKVTTARRPFRKDLTVNTFIELTIEIVNA
jgi:hypothetical protein